MHIAKNRQSSETAVLEGDGVESGIYCIRQRNLLQHHGSPEPGIITTERRAELLVAASKKEIGIGTD